MSRFATRCAAGAVPQLLAEFGDAVTYTPIGAAAVSLTASASAEVSETSGRIRRFVREFRFSRDATASYGGVARPVRGDTITLDGTVWTVDEVLKLTTAMATVKTGALNTDDLTDKIEIQRNYPTKGRHGEEVASWEYFRTNVACKIDPVEVETLDENEAQTAMERVTVYTAVDREIATTDRIVTSDGAQYAIEKIDYPEFASQPMEITAQRGQWPLASR